ncbi:helix-turn-helix domain-containing protein [Streptacidiphilus sp. P02-A3a]|uniref:helix-turn-helix domain-containing protein n=1 Tax=Streptacidiphilus sp. P02-A3a TaxID=2704468 RepID=UPI001CDBB3BC|nr:helix-turn-helix domain-containing protein [Streptacidiphilus sp. P02-A3a]
MGEIKSRLNRLFETRQHPSGRQFTNQEVADLTTETGDPSSGVSASLIQKLRSGAKGNPTAGTLKALAAAFQVRASYFIDDEAAEPEGDSPATRQDLEQLIKDEDVRNLALRADGLSKATLSALAGFIERARSLEGLEDGQAERPPGS